MKKLYDEEDDGTVILVHIGHYTTGKGLSCICSGDWNVNFFVNSFSADCIHIIISTDISEEAAQYFSKTLIQNSFSPFYGIKAISFEF